MALFDSMRVLRTLRAALLIAAAGFWRPNVAAAAESEPAAGENEVRMLDFGRPCANPQSEVDPANKLDRATRTAPRSNPESPLTQAPYPKLARLRGEEGSAVLRLLINEEGQVSEARIVRTTGSSLLDNAALEETRNWRLTPGTVSGKPQCMWGRFAFSFRLTEYTEEELANAPVTPEAERLATMLLGMDRYDEQALEDITDGERMILTVAKEAFLENKTWLDARRRVAAIASIEFTPAEIDELSRFYASPLARKLNDLQQKFQHTVAIEQRIALGSLYCAGSELRRVLKDEEASAVFEGEALSAEYARLVRDFIGRATSYCNCNLRREDDHRRGFIPADAASCGPRPDLK